MEGAQSRHPHSVWVTSLPLSLHLSHTYTRRCLSRTHFLIHHPYHPLLVVSFTVSFSLSLIDLLSLTRCLSHSFSFSLGVLCLTRYLSHSFSPHPPTPSFSQSRILCLSHSSPLSHTFIFSVSCSF